MGFFDQLSAPEECPSPARVGDPWAGPPTGVVGGWVPWRIVLVHSDNAHAFVHGFEVFETGLLFQLMARFDPNSIEFDDTPRGPVVADTCPRIGVSFSDGRKAATSATGVPPTGGAEDRPCMRGRGGTGHPGEWRRGYWLWPLPPPGPLTWHAIWPDLGIVESHVQVDASELGTAARASDRLWGSTDQG